MSNDQPIHIVINPVPSDRETAAIVAAVLAVTSTRPVPEPIARPDRWREAGKREALRNNHQEVIS